MRSRMFDTFSIKDVGRVKQKVKQLLRSPRHAWYDQSQELPKNPTNDNEDKKARSLIVMDARGFEAHMLQQFGGGSRESIQRKRGRNG